MPRGLDSRVGCPDDAHVLRVTLTSAGILARAVAAAALLVASGAWADGSSGPSSGRAGPGGGGPGRGLAEATGASGDPAACRARLAEAERTAKRDLPAARALIDEAVRLGADPREGGACSARALSLLGALAVREGDHKSATKHYRQAAHRAVEDHALWRTLTQARVSAEARAGRRDRAERIGKLLTLHGQVLVLERRAAVGKAGRAAATKALDEAVAALRTDKDPVRAEWATAVKAKVLALSGEPEQGRALAAPLAEPSARRPRFVRITAHEALAAAAGKDAEAEARAQLSVDALRAEQARRAPAERRFARSPATERACARYEKEAGDGRCAALALAATGEFSFSDPSKARPKKTLGAEELERAQQQYTPVVEACVREAAKAHVDGELFDNAQIKIGWPVRGDGRTGEVEIEPRRYEAALGPCVRERVSWFRYPRATDGQVHNVVLPFALEVTEKFGGRH
jgi:hypothetical protein